MGHVLEAFLLTSILLLLVFSPGKLLVQHLLEATGVPYPRRFTATSRYPCGGARQVHPVGQEVDELIGEELEVLFPKDGEEIISLLKHLSA